MHIQNKYSHWQRRKDDVSSNTFSANDQTNKLHPVHQYNHIHWWTSRKHVLYQLYQLHLSNQMHFQDCCMFVYNQLVVWQGNNLNKQTRLKHPRIICKSTKTVSKVSTCSITMKEDYKISEANLDKENHCMVFFQHLSQNNWLHLLLVLG